VSRASNPPENIIPPAGIEGQTSSDTQVSFGDIAMSPDAETDDATPTADTTLLLDLAAVDWEFLTRGLSKLDQDLSRWEPDPDPESAEWEFDPDPEPSPSDTPPRPVPLSVRFNGIPEELRAKPQWMLWRYEFRDDHWTKRPHTVSGASASSTNPETWTTFEAVRAAYEAGEWDGVGFAHLPDDNLVGLDWDHVCDPANGALDDAALDEVVLLGTYAEYSPSGTGFRAYAHGVKPGFTCKRGGREMYDGRTREGKPGGRFMTITGHQLAGMPATIETRQAEIDDLYHRWFDTPADNGTPGTPPGSKTPTPPPPPSGKTDDELMGIMFAAKNGAAIRQLWNGDTSAHGGDDSAADLALCSHLAFYFYTPDAVDRMFRQSGLMRKKWDRKDYRERTIRKAFEGRTSYYTPGGGAPPSDGTGEPNPAPGNGAPGNGAPGGDGKPPADPLPVRHFADARLNLDVRDFVEEWITDGTMSVTYGPTNCGKSFLMSDMALHVAAGIPWMGRAVDQRGVLYLALEGGASIENRISAFKIAHAIGDAEAREKFQFEYVPVCVSLMNPHDVERILDAVRRAQAQLAVPVGLVVVDTLSRAMQGGNENASEDMGTFITNVDRLRQEIKAHVAVIHHSGKDESKGARGHSSLRAATDTEIELTRTGDISTARVTKQRDMATGDEISFQLETVLLGHNRRGKPVTSCVVRPANRQPPDPKANLKPAHRTALTILASVVERAGRAEDGCPGDIRVVTVDEWRAAYVQSRSGDKPNTVRSAFSKAKDSLIADGFVGVQGAHVWLKK